MLYQNTKQKTISHEVTVTLKLIQVFVSDNSGSPVKHLKKEDFIVFDNGIRQSITEFEKHFTSAEESEQISSPQLNDKENQAKLIKTGRKFILLIDYFNNSVFGINKAKKAAIEFVEIHLKNNDEVAVLSYHRERGLVLHLNFSSDFKTAAIAIHKIRGIPTMINENAQEQEGEWKHLRSLQFVDQLKDWARSLKYLDGYKNILLFSSGISRKELYSKWTSGEVELEDVGIQNIQGGLHEELLEVGRELAAANSPVFTINTKGMRSYLEDENSRGDHSLKTLSDFSGGTYFYDVNKKDIIWDKIQKATTNYYILGYYINESWDGKYHSIKIEVKSPGCRIRTQDGYFNPRPFNSLSKFEKDLHLMSIVDASGSSFNKAFSLDSIALPFAYKSKTGIVMITELLINEFQEVLQKEIDIFRFVLQGQKILFGSQKGILKINDHVLEKIYIYTVHEVDPGEYRTCLVLRDDKTGKSAVGSVTSKLTIKNDFQIFSPLLLIPNQNFQFINLGFEEVSLSIRDVFQFLPPDMSPIIKAIPYGSRKFCAAIQVMSPSMQDFRPEFLVTLSPYGQSNTIPLNSHLLTSMHEEGNVQFSFLEIELPLLDKGKFSLYFEAREQKTDLSDRICSYIEIQ